MTVAAAQTTRKPRASSGWSPERRSAHTEAMRRWKPWEKSTGPTSAAGKARSSQNAFKHGSYSALERELSRLLRENNRVLRRVNAFIRLEKSLKKAGTPYDYDALWQDIVASAISPSFRGRDKDAPLKISRNELLNVIPLSGTPATGYSGDAPKPQPRIEIVDQICKLNYKSTMDDETRKLLLSAWHEDRLAALHIDAQWIFSDDVFHAIGNLAQGLRPLNVSNIWVAWPDYERRVDTGMTTVTDYHRTDQDTDYYLSRHVGAEGHETLLVKNTQSCFGTAVPHLENYLDSKNTDTLVVTGVGGRNACADKTIRQAILTDKYNIVAVTDCINHTGDDYRDHMRDITQKNPDAFERRYHEATSAEILNVLRHPSAF